MVAYQLRSTDDSRNSEVILTLHEAIVKTRLEYEVQMDLSWIFSLPKGAIISNKHLFVLDESQALWSPAIFTEDSMAAVSQVCYFFFNQNRLAHSFVSLSRIFHFTSLHFSASLNGRPTVSVARVVDVHAFNFLESSGPENPKSSAPSTQNSTSHLAGITDASAVEAQWDSAAQASKTLYFLWLVARCLWPDQTRTPWKLTGEKWSIDL